MSDPAHREGFATPARPGSQHRPDHPPARGDGRERPAEERGAARSRIATNTRDQVRPQHIPIAVDDASGSAVRDRGGAVFIDFPAGAGVLAFEHGPRSSPGNCGGLGHAVQRACRTDHSDFWFKGFT
jgi:hypothetical protein